MADNVVILSFPQPATAYEAFTELRQVQGLHSAAIVARDDNGTITVPETAHTGSGGFWTGSLIGAVVGILGGPFGVLLGWSAGALIGASYDVSRAEQEEDSLGIIATRVPNGHNVLVAHLDEPSPELLDGIADRLGGTTVHLSADEVRQEVADANEAAQKAVTAARHHRRESHRDELREKIGGVFHHGDR